jgi:hypothetical protein
MNKRQLKFMWVGIIHVAVMAFVLSGEEFFRFTTTVVLVTSGFIFTFKDKKKDPD